MTRHVLGDITEVMQTFRMPIFIVLCGYFFSPLRPTEELLRKTIRTILIPYLAFLSFYIFLMWLLQSQGAQPKDAVDMNLAAYVNAILIKPAASTGSSTPWCCFSFQPSSQSIAPEC